MEEEYINRSEIVKCKALLKTNYTILFYVKVSDYFKKLIREYYYPADAATNKLVRFMLNRNVASFYLDELDEKEFIEMQIDIEKFKAYMYALIKKKKEDIKKMQMLTALITKEALDNIKIISNDLEFQQCYFNERYYLSDNAKKFDEEFDEETKAKLLVAFIKLLENEFQITIFI